MCVTPKTNASSYLNKNLDIADLADNCDYVDWSSDHELLSNRNNQFRIIQFNIRGVRSKYHELLDICDKLNDPEVIVLCETWLKLSDPCPNIPGYSFSGCDRKNRKGGGIGILVKNNLKSRLFLEYDTDSMECHVIEVKGNRYNIIIAGIYRPPNTPVKQFVDDYSKLSERLQNEPIVLLAMDHNLDFLKHQIHSETQCFLEINLAANIIPSITKPTRVTTSSATLIDNIFVRTALPESIKSGIVVDNTSDHFILITEIANPCVTQCEPECYTTRKVGNTETNKISRSIDGINWKDRLLNKTADEAFNDFHDTLINAMNTVSPEIVKIRKIKKNTPWLTDSIKKCINKDKRLYKKSLNNVCIENTVKYRDYHKTLLRVKRSAKRNYYKTLCLEYKNDSKKLWSLINKISGKTNNKVELIQKLKIDNIYEYNQKQISVEFVSHFANLGAKFARNIELPAKPISEYLNKINRNPSSIFLNPTNECEVDKLIKSLPNKKSAGYDQINNVLLKELRLVIVEPLTVVFNKSLLEGTFPIRMKQADTVPLHKSKEKFLVTNYRPIRLLLTISKLLEKLVHSRTYSFLECYEILYNSQYGFRANHSCENAVSELLANITKGNDKNKHTIALFLDLSKAFDTLDHDILLNKLELMVFMALPSTGIEVTCQIGS